MILAIVTIILHTMTYDYKTQICAVGDPAPQGVCRGDSGGSLVIDQNGENIIVGIVSYGAFWCPNDYDFPLYLTQVSGFLSWINEKTGLTGEQN